jgi:subtilisin family serine protease
MSTWKASRWTIIVLILSLLVALYWIYNCCYKRKCPPVYPPEHQVCYLDVPWGKDNNQVVKLAYRCNELIVNASDPGTFDALIKLGFKTIDSCACNDKIKLMVVPQGVDPVGIVHNPPTGTQGGSMGLNYVFPIDPYTPNKETDSKNNDQLPRPKNPDAKDGNTIKVAIIDTGVDLFEDPSSANYLLPFLWKNETAETGCSGYPGIPYGLDLTDFNNPVPNDRLGHGTHLNGIIAGTPVRTMAYKGDNLDTRLELVNIKITDNSRSDSATLFDGVCAMHYALQVGAKVLNLSWGYPSFVETNGVDPNVPNIMNDVIQEARKRGAVIVAALGNSTTQLDNLHHFWPAQFAEKEDNVISVGAADAFNEPTVTSSFSNWSNDDAVMNLSANGNSIESNLPVWLYTGGHFVKTNRLGTWSGTSMAAPFVSRTAAILLGTTSSNGNSAGNIKQFLMQNSQTVMLPDGSKGHLLDHGRAISNW